MMDIAGDIAEALGFFLVMAWAFKWEIAGAVILALIASHILRHAA